MESALDSVRSASAYDQLTLCNGIFMLLYDQRNSMVQVDMEQEKILSMMEQVFERAKALTVQKEQSRNLQQEIIDNYDGYREAVIRAYTNAEERS